MDHSKYQIEDEKGITKLVSHLTEKEAKDELCRAMDLIESVGSLIHDLSDKAQKKYHAKGYVF